MVTYSDALAWLYGFVDYSAARPASYSTAAFDLSRMRALTAQLGQPQDQFPSLHIAGTKGKGSVAALCASALQAAGRRTGLFTSPHLLDFRERIQIDGAPIPPEAVVAGVARLRAAAAAVPGVTHWELVTALAFDYFARQAVEVAVIEVGLGGRLDMTNVLTPVVAVITSISYDHMEVLGHTLAAIAGEKAGIIKPGVPVVSAPQPAEAWAVIEHAAAAHQAPLALAGRDCGFRAVGHTLEAQTLELTVAGEALPFTLPLLGNHQVVNAAVAFLALQALPAPLAPSRAAITAGFRAVRWPGRFEIVQTAPLVVVDGAHNRESAERVAETVAEYLPGRRLHLVLGVAADKDVPGIVAALAPLAATVIATQAHNPRALAPEALAAVVRAHAPARPVSTTPTVAAALAEAIAQAGPEAVVLVTGSLFVVAEALAGYRQPAPV